MSMGDPEAPGSPRRGHVGEENKGRPALARGCPSRQKGRSDMVAQPEARGCQRGKQRWKMPPAYSCYQRQHRDVQGLLLLRFMWSMSFCVDFFVAFDHLILMHYLLSKTMNSHSPIGACWK